MIHESVYNRLLWLHIRVFIRKDIDFSFEDASIIFKYYSVSFRINALSKISNIKNHNELKCEMIKYIFNELRFYLDTIPPVLEPVATTVNVIGPVVDAAVTI